MTRTKGTSMKGNATKAKKPKSFAEVAEEVIREDEAVLRRLAKL